MKEHMVEQWGNVLVQLGDASDLRRTLLKAKYPTELLHKALLKVEGSTLQTYLGKARMFMDFVHTQDMTLHDVDPAFMADFLVEYSHGMGTRRRSPSTAAMVKALSFMAKFAEVGTLTEALKTNHVPVGRGAPEPLPPLHMGCGAPQ